MLHHQLPVLLSRVAGLWRHAFDLHHSVGRMIEMGSYYIQTSPRIFRRGFRTSNSSRKTGGHWDAGEGPLKRPLLIHYHIFKNAGTSFEWALEQVIGDRLQIFDSPQPNGILSPADVSEYVARRPEVEAISSHHATLPPPRIKGRQVFSSILVRDPITRIRSIYAFERLQQASTPGAVKAKELDFQRYVEWRLATTPAVLCNFQVHFCCQTKEQRAKRAPVPITLDRAIANLDLVDVVGTVERYEEWLGLAQFLLVEAFPGIMLRASRQNVTNTALISPAEKQTVIEGLTDDLGPALVDRLMEGNELDMRLHQVADAILTRKLAETGNEIRLRTAYREASSNLPERFAAPEPQTIP